MRRLIVTPSCRLTIAAFPAGLPSDTRCVGRKPGHCLLTRDAVL